MRLWHKALIPVLPRQQLLSQWRECCCIARNIAVNGTPNHLLVNKVLDYPLDKDFYSYCILVLTEMQVRGYKISEQAEKNWFHNLILATNSKTFKYNPDYQIFEGWHDSRYLTQCYYNLQEKYDCGGIPEEEWAKVAQLYKKLETTLLTDTQQGII